MTEMQSIFRLVLNTPVLPVYLFYCLGSYYAPALLTMSVISATGTNRKELIMKRLLMTITALVALFLAVETAKADWVFVTANGWTGFRWDGAFDDGTFGPPTKPPPAPGLFHIFYLGDAWWAFPFLF